MVPTTSCPSPGWARPWPRPTGTRTTTASRSPRWPSTWPANRLTGSPPGGASSAPGAGRIGDGLAPETVGAVAAEVGAEPGSVVVVNPVAAGRAGLVQAVVPGEGPLHFRAPDGSSRAVQLLGVDRRDVFSATVAGR